MAERVPDRRILSAFLGVVLLAGSNIVAVRFSNRELEPFWGAAIRFLGASAILWLLVLRGRYRLPTGRKLVGPVVYGLLSFALAYAFFYWGSQEVPAGLGGTIMASVPLLTVFLAAAHRLERLRLRSVGGALVALAGIAVMSSGALAGDVRVASLLAIVAAAAAAAESGVVLQLLPEAHPIVTNAIGMSVGALALLAVTLVTREEPTLPETAGVWTAVVYLAIASPFLFMLVVYVIRRWSASAASYQFVLFPIVSVIGGALLLGEPVTSSLLLGAPLVLAGVYLGALSPSRPDVRSVEKISA
ncbi:MAG TPA: EamA family transporter [Actinomycetota bacterium]|jgi:drug/metabolite transporter (DMT)-like permease|nr:EamA family transporter [Actinomycetota bacterium]